MIAMAGFILKNILPDNGGVTRGTCKVAEGHGHIIDVVETSNIAKTVDNKKLELKLIVRKLIPTSMIP